MSAFIDARGVTLRVGGRALVENIDIALHDGAVACIIGPNGAGKSTLLKLLAGELMPTAGTITCAGRSLADEPPWRLACRRAVLPQATRLFLPLRVAEVVALGFAGIGRHAPRATRAAWLDDAMATAEIVHLADRNVQTLSGGEQQRVHFARILCQLSAGRTVDARQALLLDEPTASLDLSHQIMLLEAARRMARTGTAVLVILHDLNLAAAFADRLIAMQRGRVVVDGAPAAVLTDALMRDVFGVALTVGATPDTPFVLPRPLA